MYNKYLREKEYNPFENKYSSFVRNEDIRDVMFQILKILSETEWYSNGIHDGRTQVFSFTTNNVQITRLALSELIKIALSPSNPTALIHTNEAKTKLSIFDSYCVSDEGGCTLILIDTHARADMLKEFISHVIERGYL